jgi:hypothetical protein
MVGWPCRKALEFHRNVLGGEIEFVNIQSWRPANA